jgi:hypothetical protein
MVGQARLELATPRLSSACSNQLSYRPIIKKLTLPCGCPRKVGGGNRIRTDDILLAKQALYQLSYTPFPEDGCFIEDSRLNCALRPR